MLRIIPKIEIKNNYLVKGIHLEGLRVIGEAQDFSKYYFNEYADELIINDVVASLYGRNNLSNYINEISKEVFIPITVGGGIRNLLDIENLLKNGADKIAINTAAIKDPNFIDLAVNEYGSSTITISIEVKTNKNKFECYIDNGREPTNIDLNDWLKIVQDKGCGEILITSIDRDGTGKGFDMNLLRYIKEKINVPLIISGGFGSINHIKEVINQKLINVDGIAIASLLHYNWLSKNKSKNNLPFGMSGDRINYNSFELLNFLSIKENFKSMAQVRLKNK